MKNIFKSLLFVTIIFSLVSCGNDRRKMVSVEPQGQTTTNEITFTSELSLGTIELKLYSDFLKSVMNGNLISDVSVYYIETTLFTILPDSLSVPVSLKISNFNYFAEPINIVCEKDVNAMTFKLSGKTVDNIFVNYSYYESYPNCDECNGVFIYRTNCDNQGVCDVFMQGKADEINVAKPRDEYTLDCEGYDSNGAYAGEYDVIIYDNMTQEFNFLMQDGKMEGVIGVKKSNSNDTPVLIYNF